MNEQEAKTHIAELYNALNEALPCYRQVGNGTVLEEVPPHRESVERARSTRHRHHTCCGGIFEDWLLEGVVRA